MDVSTEEVATETPPGRPRPAPERSRPASRGVGRRGLVSLVLGVVALLAGIGGFLALASLRQPPPRQEPPPSRLRVEVYRVSQADLREIISGFGTVLPDREVTLAAQVAGAVDVNSNLEVGWRVESPTVVTNAEGESERQSGTRLLSIDPETYQERLAQAKSRMAEAQTELAALEQEKANLEVLRKQLQADLEDYQTEFDRLDELRKRGVSTESEWRKARLQLRSYETQLVQNQNELDLIPVRREQIQQRLEAADADRKLAQIELERTEVRPPFSATVAEVMVETGQYVRPGDPLVRLVDERHLEIPVSISLSEFTRLAPLLKDEPRVALAVDESSPPQWHGRLVRAAPEADQQTRTINVYVEVDNAEQSTPLRPGSFVQARIEGPVLRDALPVPRLSLRQQTAYRLPADALETAENGDLRPEAVPVTVTRQVQNLALIGDGLAPGDLIVTTNLDIIPEVAANRQRKFVIEVDEVRTLEQELSEQITPKLSLIE